MIDFNNSNLIILLAGICLFLFGSQMVSHSLERVFSSQITTLMNKLSKSQFLSIGVGAGITTILQSSGAMTSMLVGLGTAKVISLTQVMGVIIGTAIGSTLTVQIISFDLATYSFPLFIIGFVIYFTRNKPVIKSFASILMGFAFLFMGIKMISTSAHYFSNMEALADFFNTLKNNSFYSFLCSMLFCAFVQSSAVTIGIAMSLASAGVISNYDAMLWVYGANIGTTSVALFAAAGSNHIGKQVAWAHFFYKTISVIIFIPFTKYMVDLLMHLYTSPSRLVANFHLFFNLASAALFYPFINKAAQIIEKMFPKSSSEEFGTEYLRLNNYQNSALAISYAQREIMRTADIFLSMLKDSVVLFDGEDPGLVQSIKERDNQVDFLYRETKMFLLDHANKGSTVVHQNIMKMIMFISDLERAADIIDINIRSLAIKKHALKLQFSPEGWAEIVDMHARVVKVASMGINAYDNPEMCELAIDLKRDLAKLEITYRENHITRLNLGLRESINTSSIHLDLLNEFRRIASIICNHAYSSLKNDEIENASTESDNS